jgi:predicted nucleic acid-binding protein
LTIYVLDASVYVSRHSPHEEFHERAKALWQLGAARPFHVPEIFSLEVVSAFARRQQLSAASAAKHQGFATGMKFVIHPVDKTLVDEAIVVARDGRTRAADAIYMALALRLQATFLTLDVKLTTHLATSTNAALRELKIQS